MEYAEKMYLVPQHQLDKARTENVRETIQQSVENDLDVAMRNILLRTDLNPYEKAKLSNRGSLCSGVKHTRLTHGRFVKKCHGPAKGS